MNHRKLQSILRRFNKEIEEFVAEELRIQANKPDLHEQSPSNKTTVQKNDSLDELKRMLTKRNPKKTNYQSDATQFLEKLKRLSSEK